MTDKEIIIDGVDVSECSYYSSETYPYTCEVWDNECEAQNCYYKQLKRLEQENAELRKDIKACNTCEHSTKIYGNEIAELKAEIETLKKVKDFACINLNNYIADNNKLKAENEKLEEATRSLFNIQYALAYSCKKYSETLQEIDEIISRTDSQHPPSVANMVSIIRHKLYELTKAESEG